MGKSKQISFKMIENDDKQYDHKTKVNFEDGAYTHIYKLFRPSKVENMLNSFGQFVTDIEQNRNQLTQKSILDYLMLHIILEFSTLGDDLPHDDTATKVILFDKLTDWKHLPVLIDSFDKMEIDKVYTSFYTKLKQYQELLQKNNELKSHMIEAIDGLDLKNKDTIKQLYSIQ